MNERRLVERFDRHRRAADDVAEPVGDLVGAVGLRAIAAGESVVGGERDERPRVLAALGQKVVGDRFGGGDRIEGPGPFAVHFRQPRPAARTRNRAAPIRPAETSVEPRTANARSRAAPSKARPVARLSSRKPFRTVNRSWVASQPSSLNCADHCIRRALSIWTAEPAAHVNTTIVRPFLQSLAGAKRTHGPRQRPRRKRERIQPLIIPYSREIETDDGRPAMGVLFHRICQPREASRHASLERRIRFGQRAAMRSTAADVSSTLQNLAMARSRATTASRLPFRRPNNRPAPAAVPSRRRYAGLPPATPRPGCAIFESSRSRSAHAAST